MWEQIDREWGALDGLGQGEAWKRRIRGIPLGRQFEAGLLDGKAKRDAAVRHL